MENRSPWVPATLLVDNTIGQSAAEPARVVLHAVGRVTQSVLSFLGPVTAALAADGARQWVLMHKDSQHLPASFDERIQLATSGPDGGPSATRWLAWLRELRRILSEQNVTIVHAHGLTPALLVLRTVKRMGIATRVYCSPHGSRWLRSKRGGGLGGLVMAPLIRQLHCHVIVNSDEDARHIALRGQVDEVPIESPVQACYFKTRQVKARRPLIVGGVYDEPERNARRFAQAAVLLGNGDRDITFNWLNDIDGEGARLLSAAQVSVFNDKDPAQRAARVAAGWIYLVPCEVHGYAQHIAEALASGTPCVVADTPHHRDLVRDGVTGFVCRDEAQMLERIALLVDEPTIARAMSTRARQVALERFGLERFSHLLLNRYKED